MYENGKQFVVHFAWMGLFVIHYVEHPNLSNSSRGFTKSICNQRIIHSKIQCGEVAHNQIDNASQKNPKELN